MSLEHGIPQFLGGAYAPNEFKFQNVCILCNSNLGRYVDASFARSWFAGVELQQCAMCTYDPNNPHYEIPLICMGASNFSPPKMLEDEVCENWLGPFGESIFLIRPHDESFYWLSGGDPVKAKRTQQKAYYFLSVNSPKNIQLSLTSFRYSFNKTKTKKIMCTTLPDFDEGLLGFSSPDNVDQLRIEFFKSKTLVKDKSRKNRLSINTKFNERFLCKLGFAIAYSLFGSSFLSSSYATELRKGIWFNPTKDTELKVYGSPTFFNQDKILEETLSFEGATVILIMEIPQGVIMNLTIGTKQFGSIKIASSDQKIPSEFQHTLGTGIVFILFKSLQKCITMPYLSFIAYKCNNLQHPELDEVSKLVRNNIQYFSK